MMAFLAYLLKVAVLLTVFYLFYGLLLKRLTLFRLNRAVLLATALLSLVLPLCVFTVLRPVAVSDTALFPASPESGASALGHVSSWMQAVLLLGYAVGALYVLFRWFGAVAGVIRVLRRGEHRKDGDGNRIVLVEEAVSPFSWLSYIVLSREDSAQRAILAHEKIHVSRRHSLDLIFIDIVSAFQWFNPVIWLMKKELCAQHEYDADASVLSGGADRKAYQYLLLEKAVNVNRFCVTNNISASGLKHRIQMMNRPRSARKSALRALYILPLVCVSLLLSARIKYVSDTIRVQYVSEKEGSAIQTPLLVIDGKNRPYQEIHSLEYSRVKSISMLSGDAAVRLYGLNGENGAIIIETK